MLAGALVVLLQTRVAWRGTVYAVFQQAEETGEGARELLEREPLASLRADAAFALHNQPGQPLGHYFLSSGTACCASVGWQVVLRGCAAHASQPETGQNPSAALARLALLMQLRPAAEAGPVGQQAGRLAMATVTHLRAGAAGRYGISAGEGELCVTLRADSDAGLTALRQWAAQAASSEAAASGLQMTVQEHDHFPAAVNSTAGVAAARQALAPLRNVHELTSPYRWSEDFALFLRKWGGALIGLGAGVETAALHTATYDFPDALIGPGVLAWLHIVAHYCCSTQTEERPTADTDSQ